MCKKRNYYKIKMKLGSYLRFIAQIVGCSSIFFLELGFASEKKKLPDVNYTWTLWNVKPGVFLLL